MKILDKEKSKIVITKLCDKFGYSDYDYIDKYLAYVPVTLFNNFISIDQKSFPMLWYPQNPQMNYIKEIWEDVLAIDNQIACQEWPGANYKIIDFLINLSPNQVCNAVGNFNEYCDAKHRAIEYDICDFEKVFTHCANMETYYFSKDLSWIFCLTHENLNFLAGTKKLIDSVKEKFSNYKEYEPKYWKEILGL